MIIVRVVACNCRNCLCLDILKVVRSLSLSNHEVYTLWEFIIRVLHVAQQFIIRVLDVQAVYYKSVYTVR